MKKTVKMSTLSAAIFGGMPALIPNRVVFESKAPVSFDGKEYGGFYVSYNNHDTQIYGGETTAVVLGQMQGFLILDGDHSDALKAAAETGGFPACLAYFKAHISQANRLSDTERGHTDAEENRKAVMGAG